MPWGITMFRNYDWQCSKCDGVTEHVVQFQQGEKPPKTIVDDCSHCETEQTLSRCLSLPSPYMGETVVNPMVSGGRFDTVGRKKLPPMPTMPDGLNASGKKDFFNSRQYKDAKVKRQRVIKENRAKQKRAALIKSGANINMRTDRLPGDPNILA